MKLVRSPPCATWTLAEMKFRLVYTLYTQSKGCKDSWGRGTVGSWQTLTQPSLRGIKNRVDRVGTTLKHPRRERKACDWWKDKSWFRRTPNWVTMIIHNAKHPRRSAAFSPPGHWEPPTVSLFISHDAPGMSTVASGCNQQTEEQVSEESSGSTLGLNIMLRPLRDTFDMQLN